MKKLIAFFSLFASVSTLLCCALPALFVVLGFGAAFAGLLGIFPALIWLSEYKNILFAAGAALLLIGGVLQWPSRMHVCPTDPLLSPSCASTRDWSKTIYFFSLVIYLIGAFFAFLAPHIL